MTQTGYKTIWQNKMETNVSLDQKLDFITKGLTFSGTFAFDTWNDNTITRSKSPELWSAQNYRDGYGKLILKREQDVQTHDPDLIDYRNEALLSASQAGI